MMETLSDSSQVIDALGGTRSVKKLTGAKSDQLVFHWRKSGRITAKHFLVMTEALERIGKKADPAIWGINEPEQVA